MAGEAFSTSKRLSFFDLRLVHASLKVEKTNYNKNIQLQTSL